MNSLRFVIAAHDDFVKSETKEAFVVAEHEMVNFSNVEEFNNELSTLYAAQGLFELMAIKLVKMLNQFNIDYITLNKPTSEFSEHLVKITVVMKACGVLKIAYHIQCEKILIFLNKLPKKVRPKCWKQLQIAIRKFVSKTISSYVFNLSAYDSYVSNTSIMESIKTLTKSLTHQVLHVLDSVIQCENFKKTITIAHQFIEAFEQTQLSELHIALENLMRETAQNIPSDCEISEGSIWNTVD